MSRLKDLFIDRKLHLANIIAGLKVGKDYILIAPRRYGKTTLAQKVFENISQDKAYLLIQIDFMRYANSVESIAEAIIENCLNALGFMGKLKLWMHQIDFSLKLKVKYANLEIEPIINLMKAKVDPFALLEQSLNLIETIAIKTQKTVIIFFDEFGELSNIDDRVIRVFRSVLQKHKNANYLFAGSQETLMTKIFVEKEGAFYRFGELLYVGEFDRGEVIAILSEMKVDFTVIDNILSTFNCHPYYTARIIKDIQIMPSLASNLHQFLEYISNTLIPSEMAYIETQRDRLSSKAYALDILISLSIGQDPYSLDIARQNVYRALKNLELLGFVKKAAKGEYYLTDPLIKLYFSS